MSLKGDIFFWTSPRPCVLGRVKGQGELGSEPGPQPLSHVFLAPRGALRARVRDGGPGAVCPKISGPRQLLTQPRTTLSGQTPFTLPVTTAPVTWRCFGATSSCRTRLQ